MNLPKTKMKGGTKTLTVNGGLRAKKDRSTILTIYSTPLARFLLKNKINKFNIEFQNNCFMVKRGGAKNISFERQNLGHPITVIRVTKLIPEKLKKKLKAIKKQLPVKIILDGIISENDLHKHNKAINHTEPTKIYDAIPAKIGLKLGCHISCQPLKNGFCYRLTVRHKIAEKIAKNKINIIVNRDKNGNFIIEKHPNGRFFNFYKPKSRGAMAYMQISPSLITETEKELFKAGRRAVSYKAYLNSNEFNIKIGDLFQHETERELAQALIDRKIKIRAPEMRKREADIVIEKPLTQIEITTIKPSKQKQKNNAHGEGIHLNARICEGFVRVKKRLIDKYVIVYKRGWEDYAWFRELKKLAERELLFIPTNFEESWAKKAAFEIINDIKGLKN